MLSLIPTEHWDYSPTDMIRGLLTASSYRRADSHSHMCVSGLGSCLSVRSARAGIVLALKALALPEGASVAVPLFCCPVVFSAIKTAGYRARFIDVDRDTYCLSATDLASKSSEVDAVIAVHMFGNVCSMPALREAARNKPFVEDCAQALGSRLEGQLAGSFGEIAVFSFRSGKYLSVGQGGAIYCNDPKLRSHLSELISELPVPSRVSECVHVVTTCLRSLLRTKPLWGLVGSQLWSAYSERISNSSPSPIVLGQVYETDRKMAVRRLSALTSSIAKQRSIADYFMQNLSVDTEMLCWEPPGAFFNRLQYPLLLPTPEQCEELAARLRKNQISTARPYKDIAAIAATGYGYTGDCPRAERIAKTVLVIPCNHAIDSADMERIARCVNHAWAAVGGRRPHKRMPSIHASATIPSRRCQGGSVAESHHS